MACLRASRCLLHVRCLMQTRACKFWHRAPPLPLPAAAGPAACLAPVWSQGGCAARPHSRCSQRTYATTDAREPGEGLGSLKRGVGARQACAALLATALRGRPGHGGPRRSQRRGSACRPRWTWRTRQRCRRSCPS
jgi:hypothetical protein